jgi:hypothetical protein
MPTTTPNFGWSVPVSTDLVKDGATAIELLGDSIDTSLVDLKGGTTGQVLAKASGTDMDFSWVAQDDSDAIQNAIVDAKGDLIAASADNTPARLAVGANGTILTADSTQATGLTWAAPPSGGVNKNYLINGGFAIAQRGTSFAAPNNNDDAYTLDRWYILSDTNDVIDVTQNTSTVPTNGQFAIALDVETVNKKFGIATIIENKDVIGLVGNTVTFSFKAKVSATTKLDNVKAAIVAWSGTADSVTSDIISAWGAEGTNPTLIANATYENSPTNLSVTTSYATYSVSAAIDTASTKNLILFVWSDVTDTTAGHFLYIAESKLELGSTATAFVYAGGTLQGELSAAQRYYARYANEGANNILVGSANYNTTQAYSVLPFSVQMRVAPTVAVSAAGDFAVIASGSTFAATAFSAGEITTKAARLLWTTSGLTSGHAGFIQVGSAGKFLEASAEL